MLWCGLHGFAFWSITFNRSEEESDLQAKGRSRQECATVPPGGGIAELPSVDCVRLRVTVRHQNISENAGNGFAYNDESFGKRSGQDDARGTGT